MEAKKLYCKYCNGRKVNGWCSKVQSYVPKKLTKEGINIAEACEHFKPKK